MSAQPQPAASPQSSDFSLQTSGIAVTGRGFDAQIARSGRRNTGSVTLHSANPARRKACKIDYTSPASWPPDIDARALRCAIHWFRDIGGFQNIAKRHLCHIVQRMLEGVTESDIHHAINAYAASKWHKEGRRWVTIQRFFVRDLLDKWIDESPELRRERDQALTAEQSRAREEADERERMLREQERIERDRRLAQRRAEQSRAREEADGCAPNNSNSVASVPSVAKTSEASIASAIEALPAADRWVIPTLLSRRVKPEVKARARDQAERVCRLIWPHLPASIQGQVDSRVVLHLHSRTQRFIDPAEIGEKAIWKLRWPQLVAIIQASRGSTAGLAAVGTAARSAARRPPTTDKRPNR